VLAFAQETFESFDPTKHLRATSARASYITLHAPTP
jgi:hypothetical protein